VSCRSRTVAALVTCLGLAMFTPAVARADDVVMYEVISQYIGAATVVYSDGSGHTGPVNVTLPWRANVAVANPYSVDTTISVDWQPFERYKWLTVRIYARGSQLCESTRDMGAASCTGRGVYGGVLPPFMPPIEPPAMLNSGSDA